MFLFNKVKKVDSQRGFTLLEILLVVGIISILAGIVILAINPTKQLGDTRDAQRRSDVLTILNAIYQYSIDEDGDIDALTIAAVDEEGDTCADDGTDALDTEIESTLAGDAATYLTAIPLDPTDGVADTTSGYNIIILENGRITVCAPAAENNTIEVTR